MILEHLRNISQVQLRRQRLRAKMCDVSPPLEVRNMTEWRPELFNTTALIPTISVTSHHIDKVRRILNNYLYVCCKNHQSSETKAVDRPLDSRWSSQRYELRCRGQPAADTTYFFAISPLPWKLLNVDWVQQDQSLNFFDTNTLRLLTIWQYCKHPNVTNTTKAWKGL